MIELSPESITIIMLGGLLLGVIIGYPLGIVVGAIGLGAGYMLFGRPAFDMIYQQMFSILGNYYLLAVPLFVFMGIMIERSGTANKMYDALYLWLGGLRGGLALTTIALGTVLAACVGVIAASVTMLTLIALPAMIKRGYDKRLAAGSVCAGGTLGILIPPSIMLVIYGPMARISVGKLFMGAFMPGFLLAGLYSSYIVLRCLLQPEMAPSVPVEERAAPFTKKAMMLITSILPPIFIILSVLGVIFMGIAPPTEAAGVGAVAATVLAAASRKLNWQVLKDVAIQTLLITAMIQLIGAASVAFTAVFLKAGGGKVVEAFVLAAPFGRWGAFAMIMVIYFVLGFFIDFIGILFIMVPVLAPLAPILGFDPVWFGIIICVNLQMSFLTPPMALSIIFLRGVVAPELGVTIGDIIRGVIPFVGLIMIGLGLMIAFPQIILWLPALMIK